MTYHEEINILAKCANKFYSSIRHRQGFKDVDFDALCESIEACIARWHGEESVPKILPWIMTTLPLDIAVLGDWYPADEAKRIRDAAWTIKTLAGRCFMPSKEARDKYFAVV